MAPQNLGFQWEAVYISSSISNFEGKLKRKFGIPKWHWLKSRKKRAVFFGLYNTVDYCRFLWHSGERTVFWCGSDILNLEKRELWQGVLNIPRATHICENGVEHGALALMGIQSEVRPCLFEPLSDTGIHYSHSETPHVFLTCHKGREEEYGVNTVLNMAPLVPEVTFHIYGIEGEDTANVRYHGRVPNERFNEEIKEYQAALRLNEFDGFAETLAKSIILGQWPITKIYYTGMTYVETKEDLVVALRDLKTKYESNPSRSYWLEALA